MKSRIRRPIAAFLLGLLASVCIAQTTADKQQEFATHVQKAQEFLRQSHPDLAIPELKAAAELQPDNVEIQGNLGVLFFFKGAFAEAAPHLRAALERKPDLTKIQGLLGIAELRTGDVADARKDLEAAFPVIEDKKFKVQAGLELVGLYTTSGDLDEAARIVAQLRKADPDNAEVTYAAYRTYSALSGEAILALSLAAPDSAQMHQAMAHEETKQGNTNGAIAQYRKAIALDPKLPGVHYELAELLSTASDANIKKEAAQEYRAALAANPQDEKTECRLGEIDAQNGNNAKALEEFTRAVELQPNDADAKLDLAKILEAMNQPDKALALLEQAVQLDPANATAHYRLGMLYRQKGRTDDAKREMESYKQYKDMKEKLRALYKEMQIQPSEIRDNEPNEK